MKALCFLFAAVSLSIAQSVTIRGTVKDTAGVAITGAVVKLETAGFQTTSGADGSFTLTDLPSNISYPLQAQETRGFSALIQNGSLWVDAAVKSEVVFVTYDLHGRTIDARRRTVDAGIHALALPRTGAGIFLYKVKSGQSEYVLKGHVSGCALCAAGGPLEESSTSPFAKQATAAASFRDVIATAKTGFLTNRLTVTNPTAASIEIRLLPSAGTLTDASGNEYLTVKLGNQVWMAEHLRTTKYTDGTDIPLVTAASTWNARTMPAYCFFNNTTNADTIKRYGALYNWHTVNTGKLAPAGWRFPSESDWMTLQNWLIANGYNYDNTKSGNKIGKAMASVTDWTASGNAGAIGNDPTKNNRSGFNAFSNGFRSREGAFGYKGTRCIMHCTATKIDQWGSFGYFGDLDNTSAEFRYSDDWMSMGFSARCLKN